MKKKLLGLVLLILLMGAIGGIYLYKGNQKEPVSVSGYLGGEKVGLFEDPELQKILQEEYGLTADYLKAGSLDMVNADLSGQDYLFPSSSIALEYYEDLHGKPARSEIILNTPIVLYTHQMVAEAFEKQGLLTWEGDVGYVDMEALTRLIVEDTQWSEIGLSELYGKVSVDTTDPAKSNSGNMFAALLANVLNGGDTLTQENLESVLTELQAIFGKLGYMETSSADLFSQFLKMGVGAKPLIAGYESQLIEYSVENPEAYDAIKEDIVMLYPSPTVWSSHVLIALDDGGKELLDALLDEKIQMLAWEKHGFRTENYAISGSDKTAVEGVADTLTRITQIPSYAVMKQMIEAL